eukprot:4883-Pyramimonas_sp.AAC.1
MESRSQRTDTPRASHGTGSAPQQPGWSHTWRASARSTKNNGLAMQTTLLTRRGIAPSDSRSTSSWPS